MQALAEACDRASAAIASAVVVDFSMITSDKTQNVIDKDKLRRERAKSRNETKKMGYFFEKVDGTGFDGGQDATLAVDKINEKHFTSTISEEHYYVVTVDSNNFYLDHFTPESERGLDIAHGLWQVIHGTKLEDKLFLIICDGININTG